MSTSQGHIRKREKTTSACRRCKDQHIRCDAGTTGIPCSQCRRVGNPDCHLATTRRSRATNGRFATSKPRFDSRDHTELTPFISPRRRSCTSERVPPFAIDFEALCNNPHRNPYASSEGPTKARHQLYGGTRQASAYPIWGESWYLSYVIQTTDGNHDRLYQPILETQGSSSSLGRQNNPTPTSYHTHQEQARTSVSQRALPSPELRDALLRDYFSVFHSFCPILDRAEFLASVNDGSVSKVLLHCVLFIASIHCDLKTIHLLGYDSRIEAEDDLFGTAKAAFDSEQETDRLVMLLCSYLLHYWSGSASKGKDSLWWLAGTIRSAQCMGMHRKIQQKTVDPGRERMWRRIWWLLYIRDRQISISLGKPMIINDCDCDVDLITEGDLWGESQTTISYILAQAHLSISVSKALRTYFAPAAKCLISDETLVLSSLCTMFSEWDHSLPPDLQWNRSQSSQLALLLNLNSNYYRIIVHRELQREFPNLSAYTIQTSNDIIMDASQRITDMTESAVTHLTGRYFPMICVSAIFAAMTAQFTQANAPNQTALKKNSLWDSIKYKLLALKEFEDCHILAGWIRQLFLDMFNQQKPQSDAHQSELITDGSECPDGSLPGDALNIPSTEASFMPLSAINSDGIITDASHPATRGIAPSTVERNNTGWNNCLLNYQDANWNNVSEGAMIEQLMLSLSDP